LNPGARLHRPGGRGNPDLIDGFFDFCRVDLGLSPGTAMGYRRRGADLRAEEDEGRRPEGAG